MRVRLAAETPKEREARLQQMSTYQRERLAAETVAERERGQAAANEHLPA